VSMLTKEALNVAKVVGNCQSAAARKAVVKPSSCGPASLKIKP